MNVLVTDITSYKAIVFVKAIFNKDGINIITGDFRKGSKIVRTKYSKKHEIYTSSKKSETLFIDDIIHIIKKHDITHLIPINSRDIRILLKNKNKLHGALDYMGTYDDFLKLDNKENLSTLISDLNILYPKKYTLESSIEKFPIVFKPTESSSSKGVVYINNQLELNKFKKINREQKYVLQEYIKGDGVGYSILAKNGKIMIGCAHLRKAEYPVSGGSSTIRTHFEHKELEAVSEKIIKKAMWSGLAMLEFKVTPDNQLYLIEVNPRVWGSINQSIQTGVNFPLLLVTDKLDEEIRKININKKAITYISPLHIFSLIGYLLKGRLDPMRFFLKNYKNAISDVSLILDPLGYMSMFSRF